MSRAPHQTLAHLVRDAECAGKCRQGRPSSTACLHKSTCGSYMTSLHRVTPVQPDPEENSLLAFLDGWLTNLHMLAIGGIAAGLVAGAFLIVYILTNYLDFVALVARMHT